MKHPVEHLRFPEAAVEPVAKFPQVAGQIFVASIMASAQSTCLAIWLELAANMGVEACFIDDFVDDGPDPAIGMSGKVYLGRMALRNQQLSC